MEKENDTEQCTITINDDLKIKVEEIIWPMGITLE